MDRERKISGADESSSEEGDAQGQVQNQDEKSKIDSETHGKLKLANYNRSDGGVKALSPHSFTMTGSLRLPPLLRKSRKVSRILDNSSWKLILKSIKIISSLKEACFLLYVFSVSKIQVKTNIVIVKLRKTRRNSERKDGDSSRNRSLTRERERPQNRNQRAKAIGRREATVTAIQKRRNEESASGRTTRTRQSRTRGRRTLTGVIGTKREPKVGGV